MSYTVPFPRHGMTRREKEAAALKECKAWLNKKQLETVKLMGREYVAAGWSLKRLYKDMRMALCFAGVQGYWPVRAMVRYALTSKNV